MFNTGILILSRPIPVLKKTIDELLKEVSKVIDSTLYVHIQQCPSPFNPSKFKVAPQPVTSDLRSLVTQLYSSSAIICNHIDVRILLGHITNNPNFPWDTDYKLSRDYDVVLFDDAHWKIKEDPSKKLLMQYLSQKFQSSNCQNFSLDVLRDVYNKGVSQPQSAEGQKFDTEEVDHDLESYNHVVMGGTFDRPHIGHKILLGEGCLQADKSLTVGVTTGKMNANKTLPELIDPVEKRVQSVIDFIRDVRPGIEPKVVPITDMYGPSTVDPDLQCIILSQETVKGGQKVNEERLKKGLSQLKEYVIPMIEDRYHNEYEETKISSSSQRKRLLGTVLHPIKKKHIPPSPYVIGLTGGIASGKTSVCRRLEKLGAGIIDCDKLGHQVYVNGEPAYEQIKETFGQGVITDDGQVNRRALGSIVFSDPKQLKSLNSIVWPEIQKLAQAKIQQYKNDCKRVVILDAAVLLEAGWDDMVHEVWTTFVSRQEAIKRMFDRNKLSEEEAIKRLDAQITNEERINKSNVVLCTLWERSYTQLQVEKAWELLRGRTKAELQTRL